MSNIRIPLWRAPTVPRQNENLMKTNDLRQFPSPTGSRELNAPHGELFTNFSNQNSADSLDFRFRSLSVLLASFWYKAQLCDNEMRNLMKTNDLRQFPSPTGSRELNAPHGGLWRLLRPSTDTCQERLLHRWHRQIFQIVTGLFKTRA